MHTIQPIHSLLCFICILITNKRKPTRVTGPMTWKIKIKKDMENNIY